MIKETPNNDDIKVTLIDFNVSRKFREKSDKNEEFFGTNRLLMMTNTGAAAFCAPEMQSNASYW